jgi:hypothetical protein
MQRAVHEVTKMTVCRALLYSVDLVLFMPYLVSLGDVEYLEEHARVPILSSATPIRLSYKVGVRN